MAPGGDEVALHPVVKVLWRIQTLLGAGAGAVVMVTAAAVVDGPVLLRAGLLGAAVAGVALAFWLPGLHYRAWGYRLDDKALELHHGVFTVHHSLVPYFRVQHVDVSQGPLERRLGLARLKIHTASAGTDASLPGVEMVRAEDLRRLVLDRAEVGDGV